MSALAGLEAATAPSAPRPQRRRRRGLVLLAVLAAVLIYLIWWTTYSGIHFTSRYDQLPSRRGGELRGATVTLVSLTRTDLLADAKGRPPAPAASGATWVVATIEVEVHADPKDFFCSLDLLGPQRQRWESITFTPSTRSTPRCSGDDLVVGRPVRFEEIYEVPSQDADRLAGIVLDDSSTAARVAVLTPGP